MIDVQGKVTAGWTTLLNQAAGTADTYLHAGVKCIDDQFGKGYAAQHPELLAAYMKACTDDFWSASFNVALQNAMDEFSTAISNVVEQFKEIS